MGKTAAKKASPSKKSSGAKNAKAEIKIGKSKDFAKETTLNLNNVKKGAKILRALNHEIRQSVLGLLDKEEKLTVSQMYQKLNMDQSVASQHLAILRQQNVVHTQRRGKNIIYSLNRKEAGRISKLATQLVDSPDVKIKLPPERPKVKSAAKVREEKIRQIMKEKGLTRYEVITDPKKYGL